MRRLDRVAQTEVLEYVILFVNYGTLIISYYVIAYYTEGILFHTPVPTPLLFVLDLAARGSGTASTGYPRAWRP